MIKYNNVREQAQDLSVQIFERWQELLQSGDFILGDEVVAFESWMSNRCGGAHTVAVNSGTDALFLALCAFGIGPGDEVITCGNTFVATVGAIVSTGARPVLADVGDDELMNIDTIAPLLNDRTKAVIPVYLRGRPLDIDAIVQLCHSYSVVVIEDCAQAIGTTVNGQQVGTHADASAFSMHPLKTLGGLGDGGILVSRDIKVAEYARIARNHGLETRNESIRFGFNSRLDSLQAAALNVKAQYVDRWLKRRLEIAGFYDDALSTTRTGTDLGGGKLGNSYYHYVVQSTNRDGLQAFLTQHDIQTAIHYPIPIHRQKAWSNSQPHIVLPTTERLSQQILTLPCHHHLSDGDVEKVASLIKQFERMEG
ncbi:MULTISPECIES: DegT/DnrJ/EryC1/StrS family aminotransferase [Pseudomonas]|uniref:DegT/DnrJ/EryC1/StrS family aminotransferase n=1 Tax=Pseudomonas TaxID=286 RepID=UPI000EB5EBB5|nr:MULTISPECIES: DegT/DnrJ/EryC1/StrS family aminotransferase [Pseudomonas]EKW7734763.1 DegT/DnrJ/EryC1/StrS family aminotransferase [Pseudomonas aeruginosa]MBH8712082.1 DegT/DnrJ/EryC1/StrS family aminotransferase [Pseudomonas aeruginosa]MBH9457250.1 DegT/DnrJ/EryC1/StrS family aminotransferase [Pseudomonas aeruginosa]MBH9462315.1 DegT/DnrJ/EryC1/StrS family aminotransferase [Pseudomonas aeruginosa]MBI8226351.1 DegT/DnrJ/EryC1/StrS family aminotransferase [Pseudomonas aeruginosa]